EAVGFRHAYPGIAQLVERLDLGVLPLRLLLAAAVTRGLADRARLAAAPHLAPLLVLDALLEAALCHVLVDLGAADLASGVHHVDRGLLAALERTQDRVDHAVFDQRLQAGGCLHRDRRLKARQSSMARDRAPAPETVRSPSCSW